MAVHAKLLLHNPFFRRVVYFQSRIRADYLLNLIESYLKETDSILDLGAGSCVVSEKLREKNFAVTPVDIADISLVNSIQPLVYDGQTLPFKDNQFDVSLLLVILHHTPRPEDIIREAMRVSKRLLILEDIFSNPAEQYMIYAMDCVVNQEFRGHPHSNKTDEQWKSLFDELNLSLRDTQYSRLAAFRHALYYLEKRA